MSCGNMIIEDEMVFFNEKKKKLLFMKVYK